MSNDAASRGLLFIVSAPSGAGKTTVVEQVIARTPGTVRSISYTCRARRGGEVDGRDYHFVSQADFEAMIAEDGFLEHADVFGNLYGTGRAATERQLAAGLDLILVIDVQGASQVRRHGVPSCSIFLMPPSASVLEARLRGRSQDSEQAIARRLGVARDEVKVFGDYDYVVVNDDAELCAEEVRAIVLAERARLWHRRAQAEAIAATFRA